MTTENWKLQVSMKATNGDLINVRANTADELSVLLEGIADYSHQVAATSKAIAAAYTVLPLATGGTTQDTAQQPSFVPTQAPTQSVGAGGMSTPTCVHGARIFRQGVSKTNGKPYAFWACPTPQGTPDQCKPVN
jgi:hypothetical protein